jgi:hypothetical protein
MYMGVLPTVLCDATCMPGAHRGQKRSLDPMELVTDSCELLYVCWDLNLDLVQELSCAICNSNY